MQGSVRTEEWEDNKEESQCLLTEAIYCEGEASQPPPPDSPESPPPPKQTSPPVSSPVSLKQRKKGFQEQSMET